MWKIILLMCFSSPRKLYEKMVLLKQLEYPGLQSYYKLKLLQDNKYLFSENESLFLEWNFTE